MEMAKAVGAESALCRRSGKCADSVAVRDRGSGSARPSREDGNMATGTVSRHDGDALEPTMEREGSHRVAGFMVRNKGDPRRGGLHDFAAPAFFLPAALGAGA